MKKTLLIVSTLTISALAFLATQSSTNANSMLPNDGNAGAPMDASGQTCASCHSGIVTSTTGVISSNIPSSGYVAGSTYNFTVTMSGALAYGFEITPQTASSSAGLGTLIAGAGTAISSKYIKQSVKKLGASAVWTFQWTAPSAPTVTFYGAFNYSNNNGSTSGDIVKTSSETYTLNSVSTSIKEVIDTQLFSVFPNPTTDLLYVNTNEIFSSASIYNTEGKLIKIVSDEELNSKIIHVENLSNGSYILNMISGEKHVKSKFIKND